MVKSDLAEKLDRKIYTDVAPYTGFNLAEDYHQKYSARNNRVIFEELSSIYPRISDFVNSTAVARVNGYLGGNGNYDQLVSELPELGLTERSGKLLLRLFEGR